jgi:hypothetical protein
VTLSIFRHHMLHELLRRRMGSQLGTVKAAQQVNLKTFTMKYGGLTQLVNVLLPATRGIVAVRRQ